MSCRRQAAQPDGISAAAWLSSLESLSCVSAGSHARSCELLFHAGGRRQSMVATVLRRGSLVGVPLGARRGSVLLDGPNSVPAIQASVAYSLCSVMVLHASVAPGPAGSRRA